MSIFTRILGARGDARESDDAAKPGSSSSASASTPPSSAAEAAITTAHWVPDAAVSQCVELGCGRVFGLTERKVHCRRCGRIFCGEHAQMERKLNALTAQPDPEGGVWARVCASCYFERQEIGAVRDLTEPFQVLRGALRERDAKQLAKIIVNLEEVTTAANGKVGKGKEAADGRQDPLCSLCKAPFGMLSRRRHCKLCGAAVCASCGANRVTAATAAAAAAADSAGLPPDLPDAPDGKQRAAAAAGEGGVRACKSCWGRLEWGARRARHGAERHAALASEAHTAYCDVQAAWRTVERELPMYARHVDWLEEAARPGQPLGRPAGDEGAGGLPRLDYLKYERYRECEERLVAGYKQLQAAMLRVRRLAQDPAAHQGVARNVSAAVVQFLQETTASFRSLQMRLKALPLTTHPLFRQLEVAYGQKRQEREEAAAVRGVYVALARMQAEAARHRLFRPLAADFHELLPAVRADLQAASGAEGSSALQAAEAEVRKYEARHGRSLLGPAADRPHPDERAVLMRMAEVLVVCLADLDARPRSRDRFHCTRYWLITLREKIKSQIETLL